MTNDKRDLQYTSKSDFDFRLVFRMIHEKRALQNINRETHTYQARRTIHIKGDLQSALKDTFTKENYNGHQKIPTRYIKRDIQYTSQVRDLCFQSVFRTNYITKDILYMSKETYKMYQKRPTRYFQRDLHQTSKENHTTSDQM